MIPRLQRIARISVSDEPKIGLDVDNAITSLLQKFHTSKSSFEFVALGQHIFWFQTRKREVHMHFGDVVVPISSDASVARLLL